MENQYPLLRIIPLYSIQTSIISEKDAGSIASPDIQIIYVLRGALTVHRQALQLPLEERGFILFNPNEEFRLEAGDGLLAARFLLPKEIVVMFGGRENTQFFCCSARERKAADEELRSIFTGILQSRTRRNNGNPVEEIKLTFDLLHLLQSRYSVAVPAKGAAAAINKPNQRLLEICTYMQANFRQPLTLNEVAERHYVSVPYLSKSFKKEMGMTFSEYLNRIRLDYAIAHLLYTDQPITRIALDSGFPSLTAFNRVFREMHQLTPSQYRKAALDAKAGAREDRPELQGSQQALDELVALLARSGNPDACVTVLNASAEQGQTYKRVWKELINIGYARDLLNSDLQEQLTLIHGELGFSYARVWGIFSEEMMIEDPSDPDTGYNFSNIDKLIDILLKSRLRPYLELGDKPKLIQKNASQKMGAVPALPKQRTAEEWKRLIRAFLIHCINRYGGEEVEGWYFELWHSSKHAFLSEGVDHLVREEYRTEGMEQWFDDYFIRFELTWKELKELLPGAKLGGCGLSMDLEGRFLPLLLDKWSRREIHPDFLSLYLYPYEFTPSPEGTASLFTHSPDEQWILHTLQSVRRLLAERRLEHIPLHISEWNFSISNRDYLNDSLFKASYILKNMTEAIDEQCLMGYWLYSDIFSEFRDSKRLLYGGAGLISKNGIKKPAYYAFSFLNRMGKQLIGKGRDYLLTKRSEYRYQLLCYHYRHLDVDAHCPAEGGCLPDALDDAGGPAAEPTVRNFRLEGLKDGSYRLKRSYVGSSRGSILQEWKQFGAVHDIRPDEIQFLKQICVPSISVEHVEVRGGSLEISSVLKPHEVGLIELELRMDTL
ncbi:helix-turn-helix domain-containing protein [Paenibacillus sp. NFR01]|uniref:GH39 family glycosyl hydrolase n=1 Tax=Paenibacillus sp. NFR01 TaxID=1566279 RepID=UPI0008CB3316|nr:helix-turn-helix domain-containing protein [Paenibacillus sp. NFR01]SET22429.1 Helix-turn-helix domain-containing protein [Paenibacillus sp. NFR01]